MRPTITDPGRDLFYAWLDEERNRRSGDIPSTSTTKAGGTSAPAHTQPETRELIVSREDELLHAIKVELEQLRVDRALSCHPGCEHGSRLDYEQNAINMAEAAVDRAARRFPPVVPATSVMITPSSMPSGIATGIDFDAGMRQGSMRMET